MVAGGNAVLQRLAALNRSGVLVKPLQFSQVKVPLSSISEDIALGILQELQEMGASVPDPVEYVKDAVVGAGGSAGGQKRKAEAVGPGGASAGGSGGVIAKRVRLLNSSGQLTQPIVLDRVGEALGSLGVGQAMTILKGLEDAAEEVRDPTGYIKMAVRASGGFVPADDADDADEGEDEEIEKEDMPEEDAAAEEEEEAEEFGGAPAPPRVAVKQELMGGAGAPVRAKKEVGLRDFRGTKTEDLTEAEKIERRVVWINHHGNLNKQIDPAEVLPALDCIGFRQSMRVLRRLEESGPEVENPAEFIKDLVARSGWIWAKPDVIDDDEKVAKRVGWLNLFGGFQQPIDYAEVADSLDGLKVAHAMVLLRELELQAHKVPNPTDYIKKTVALAGEDDVHVPIVDEDSSIGQRILELNNSGVLAAPIEFLEVGEDLARIGEGDALQLIQEVENKGSGVKDPTGYIKFKLKAKLASLGTSLEDSADDETKILKRIEWLNDYGGLVADIDYNQVAATLESVGIDHAMTILKELEDKRAGVQDPNFFILNAVSSSWKRTANSKPAGRGAAKQGNRRATQAAGTTDLKTLTGFVGFLNKNSKSRKPIKFSDIATALDNLGSQRAFAVLQEMQERGLGLDDPVTYIRAASNRSRAANAVNKTESVELDDVGKIAKRLNWLNQFGGLSKKINNDEVIGALYCLGIPQSMAILRGLQEKGKKVADPTSYVKNAVQRANGVRISSVKQEMGAEAAGEEAYDEEDDEEEEEVEQDEDAGEAGEEQEAEDEEEIEAEAEMGEEADADAEENDTGDLGMEEEEPDELAADAGMDGADESMDGMEDSSLEAALGLQSTPKVRAKTELGEMRVVGALTGYKKLVPTRQSYKSTTLGADDKGTPEQPKKAVVLPPTPQEKLVQIRELALKSNLNLDQACLKNLARLPYAKAKDLIDDVMLGGRDRRGVSNPSRYLMIGVSKAIVGLGVEQGLAMELAVSLGVVLNNDSLDELACIPRKESHSIIRELSRDDDARVDPVRFIANEVMKCRAQYDARPWGK